MAGEQEIGIKLKADTSQAIKSVKDLEKAVTGIGSLQKKGEFQDGFLSERDVAKFRSLSSQATRIYKDFYSQLGTVHRQIQNTKKQIEKTLSSGGDTTSLTQTLKYLEGRQTILQNNARRMNQLAGAAGQRSDNVRNMHSGGLLYDLARHYGGRFMGLGGLMMGINWARQGSDLITQYENRLYPAAQMMGGYNGNFGNIRRDALNTGLPYGYTVGQMAPATYSFMNQAGARNGSQGVWSAMGEIARQSRATGLDLNFLSGVEGSMYQRGGLQNPQQQRLLMDAITGAVDKTKMAGRQYELVQAFNDLSINNSQGLATQTNKQLNNILGLQSLIGSTGMAGLQGAAGANFLSQVDQSMKSGGIQQMIAMGFGRSSPSTYSNYLGMQYQMEAGIADPKNFASLMQNADTLYKSTGGSETTRKQAVENYLKQNFGGSMHLWEQVWGNDSIRKGIEGGQLSMDKLIQTEQKQGDAAVSKQLQDYLSSQVGTRNLTSSQQEKSQQNFGNPINWLSTQAGHAFFSLPTWAQGLIWGGGTLAGGLLGRKAISMLGRRIGGGGGGGILDSLFGGVRKVGGDILGEVGASGGSLLKAGKLARGLLAPEVWLPMIGDAAWNAGIGVGNKNATNPIDQGTFLPLHMIHNALNPDAQGNHWYDHMFPQLSAMFGPNFLGDAGNGIKGGLKWLTSPFFGGSATQNQKDVQNQESKNIRDKNLVVDKERAVVDKQAEVAKQLTGATTGDTPLGGIPGKKSFLSSLWGDITGIFTGSRSNNGYQQGSSTALSKVSLSGNGTSKQVYNFLKSKGLSDGAIAGILGNFQQESQMNPNAPGGGLAQWIGSRQASLQTYAKHNGMSPNSLGTQLGFLWSELSSGKYGSISSLNKMSPTQAAAYFEKNFEQASNPMMSNRVSYANSFYSQMQGSSWNADTANAVASSRRSSSSGSTTITHNVVVSGSIQGMKPEDSHLVASAIAHHYGLDPKQLSSEQRQGIGGNR